VCSNRDNHNLLQDKDGTPGEPFGDKVESNTDGPACPECGKPTGRYETSNRHGFFRCAKGHGTWWDDKGAIGKLWETLPAGKGGKAKPEAAAKKSAGKPARKRTGKPAARRSTIMD
jgi:DNA topoisomerase-1